ncbi:hypothetical protein EV121DRAFT_297233 [Schizophyllum commune]
MNPNSNSHNFTPADAQGAFGGASQRLPDLSIMDKVKPAEFVEVAACSLGLLSEHRRELHTFRLLGGSDMTDGALNMAIWTQASVLDIRQALQMLVSSVSNINTTLTTMKTMTAEQAAANLSTPQRNGINKACKVIVRQHKATNGLKQYFDNPDSRSDDMVRAVNSWLSAKATANKGEFKKHLTIGLSRGKQRRSLSVATQKATKTFLDLSTPELEHFVFMLILRSFTRTWMATPADRLVGLKRSITEATSESDDGASAAAEAKEAIDFWAIMTGMFAQRSSWGKDWKAPQWRSFIAEALEWEQHNFPEDTLTAIPLEYKSDTSPSSATTAFNMHFLPPHASPASRLADALPRAVMASGGQLLGVHQPISTPSQLRDGPPSPRIENSLNSALSSQPGLGASDMTTGDYPRQYARAEGAAGGANSMPPFNVQHVVSPYPGRSESGGFEGSSAGEVWGPNTTADSSQTAGGSGDNASRAFNGFHPGRNLRDLMN